MEKKKIMVFILFFLAVLLVVLILHRNNNEKEKIDNNYGYNSNNYTQSISSKELAMSAVYNNTYEFASKAKVANVNRVVVASCSMQTSGHWRVLGYFYGEDIYGHIDGIYNYTCDVTVADGYANIYRCIVEKDY